MEKVSHNLKDILKFGILSILVILTIYSAFFLKQLTGDDFSDSFFLLEIFLGILGAAVIFLKISTTCKIWILLLIGLFLRIFWAFSIDTFPKSDFYTMYESANRILAGDMSVLKGYSYLGRFPHLIPMTLYITIIMKIFPVYNLIVLKLLNTIFSCISVYLLYKLSVNFIKHERNRLFVLMLGVFFSPFITYTSVLCSENLAIPLYLVALNIFYKSKNTHQNIAFFLTGVCIALGNFFRAVGIVLLIACSIDIFLDKLNNKYIKMLYLVLGYIVFSLCTSLVLLKIDIIERPLWLGGSEPGAITLLLKGTNFESKGMWSIEDAKFIEKHLSDESFSNICLEEIKQRLASKTPVQLAKFYFEKIISQWKNGDCLGTYWAYTGADIELLSPVPIVFQITYFFILIFSIIGEIKKSSSVNFLINIILFGFILLFAIIETQPRYSYISSWVFIILAGQGIDDILVLNSKNKVRTSISVIER